MASSDPTGGTLADRVRRTSTPTRHTLPCHVWIDSTDPGVLLAWERDANGQWWGRVLHSAAGVGVESLIVATRIRPAA